MKKLLSIIALAFVGCASGQTLTNSVTFTLTDWLQSSYTNRPVTIQGVSTPRTNPPYIAVNFLLNTNSGTTGAFTLTNILDGTYRVTIAGAVTPTVFSIYVPTNQGAVHSASSLLTTSIVDNATTAYTKAQANALFASRAGTNIVLTTNNGFVTINSTASGGGGSVTGSYAFSAIYPLTNNTVSTNVIYGITNNWSNLLVSAAGALATNQVTVASNALASQITTASNGVTSAFGAADTVVSNALQSGIDGKTNRFPLSGGGITISSATTNGIAFDVFTVAGTGGTAPTNNASTGILIATNNTFDHTFAADTNTLATRAWATEADTVVSNGLNSAKMDVDGGNAAATVIFSGAFEASTITPQNTIDASVSGSEISFGATYYIKNLASAGITIGKGAQSYLALSDVTGAGILFGGAAPRSSVAGAATTEIIRWDEWSSSNTTLQANINAKTNAVLLSGTNISLGDGTTNGVRFFTVSQRRPLPLALVAGPATNDVVAATNMSATFSFPFAVTLAYATVSTREAPATTALILDVNTNGVSIFSNTNRLSVPVGGLANTNSSFNSTAIPADARITVDVDVAPGSGTGRAPTATLWYYPQ